MQYELGNVAITQRKRLPHWHAEHAIYFLTWSLADALPGEVLARFRARRDEEIEHIRRVQGKVTHVDRFLLERAYVRACQSFLDEHSGECLLRHHEAAEVVANAITYFDEVRYELYCWCVMPNHVHLVLSFIDPHGLRDVLHSLKSFTSKEINKRLGRCGVVWQDETFDRCVRDSKEMERVVRYVVNNPMKAGLLNWPFVRSYPNRIAEVL